MKILRKQNVTLEDLLPVAIWEALCADGKRRSYVEDQLIADRGEVTSGLILVTSGEIAVGNVRKDGSFLVSGLLRRGDCSGQVTTFLGLPRTHSLWATGDCEVVFINKTTLSSRLDSHPAIYEALLKLALWQNVETLDFLDTHRRLTLPLRIARLILTSPGDDGDADVIECRQEDLADILGVSRVAIGKALKKLQAEELLQIGYGKITLLDREKLHHQAFADHTQA
ncbi:Crp/Fnr family transcriptional regulator [Congregibacter sp.]|uniref:Crp/Fnr family transcriptional regulator n=1 Tax=Congregibacter sp. TaxID=2744308 RepID=UPI00385DEA7A